MSDIGVEMAPEIVDRYPSLGAGKGAARTSGRLATISQDRPEIAEHLASTIGALELGASTFSWEGRPDIRAMGRVRTYLQPAASVKTSRVRPISLKSRRNVRKKGPSRTTIEKIIIPAPI